MLSLYSDGLVKGTGFSEARDTQLLIELLKNEEREIYDAGDAGTAFRFLSSYLAIKGREVVLTGSNRMKERPIGPLVDTLRQLGASIKYLDREGFPPVAFGPFNAQNRTVSIRGDVSSQYISSIMMAAPTLPYGLNLRITGKTTSYPYLQLTWKLMQKAGIEGVFGPDKIQIPNQKYKPLNYQIEPDWSAAGYFYAWIAAAPKPYHLYFPGLRMNSEQGDAVIAQLMTSFGIQTSQKETGVEIRTDSSSIRKVPKKIELDLEPIPDQAQTLICLCAVLGVEARLWGLKSLVIKETNRLLALQKELKKIGLKLEIDESQGLCWLPGKQTPTIPTNLTFSTYGDHRMAMSLQLFALKGRMQFDHPEVVVKSFPNFWQEIAKV